MHEHPNQRGEVIHQHHLTPPARVLGQIASFAVPALQKFSLNEKNADFLDSCVRAASLAVDEARAGLSLAITGTDDGLIDHAARAYKQAAMLHLQAQQERCELRGTFSTPPPHTLMETPK